MNKKQRILTALVTLLMAFSLVSGIDVFAAGETHHEVVSFAQSAVDQSLGMESAHSAPPQSQTDSGKSCRVIPCSAPGSGSNTWPFTAAWSESVTANNATIRAKISGRTISATGFYLGTSSGNLAKRHTEQVGAYTENIWYNLINECGITLNPGTTYYYKFFVVINGTEYQSGVNSFTTNTWPFTAVWSDSVTANNATIRATISGRNISSAGFYLGTSSGNLAKRHTEQVGKYTENIWYNLINECGITLNPGTTYYYKFFVVINGAEYQSEIKSLVTVSKVLSSVSVKQNPSKMTYVVGESFNTSGLVLTARYNDGSTSSVTKGYTCSPAVFNRVGSQTVTISYGGKSCTLNVTVRDNKAKNDISKCTVTLSQTSFTYDGTAKKPAVTVKNGTKTLVNGTDYTVSYSNNTNVGTAKVTVTGKGNYSGSQSFDFTIKKTTVKFTNGADNWRFSNYQGNFGNSYYMSDKYWNALMMGLSNTEKQDMINKVKNANWQGSCYGMAVTSILASHGILKPSQYQNGANFLHDISAPPSNEVKSLINYYYALQFTDVIYQQMIKNYCSDNEKAKLNSLLTCLQDKSPTLLCFYWPVWDPWSERSQMVGHAVVAYGVEYGKYSYNGKAFNGKILVYDNNNINYSDDYCFYFNSSDGSWMVPHHKADSKNGGILGFVTDDIKFINYHGYLNGTSNVTKGNYYAVLDSAAIAGNYTLTKAKYSKGKFAVTNTSDDDIKEFSSLRDTNPEKPDIMFAMRDASAGYVLSAKKPQKVDLSLSYENSLLLAKASNAATAKFAPNSFIEIDGNKTDYNLGIVLNKGYTVCDWYGITVEGKNADKVVLEATKNGYFLTSSNLINVTVTGYNDSVKAKKTFSTNYKKVYLYEINKTTIGAAVDTDNNGTYETVLKNSAPSLQIINQPADFSAKKGETVKLSVKAEGVGLTYQWYYKKSSAKSWTKWNKQTKANVSFKMDSGWNNAQFYCLVKDKAGKSAKTQPAKATLTLELKITTQPKNVSVKTGKTASFSVKATGNGLKYQWYYKKKGAKSWTKWSGKTKASVSLKAAKAWNGAQFYCQVTDGNKKSVNSKASKLTVKK